MKKSLLYLFCFVSILLQPQYLYGQDKLTKKGYKITWLDNLKKYYLVLKPSKNVILFIICHITKTAKTTVFTSCLLTRR